jgi:hypothetical protein
MTAKGYAVTQLILEITPQPGGTATSVECEVTGVDRSFTEDTVTWRTACPDGKGSAILDSAETLDVGYVLDYTSPTSLTRILDANAGAKAIVSFTPDPVGDPTYILTGEVTLARGNRTHQVGALAAATASWPVNGTLTAA